VKWTPQRIKALREKCYEETQDQFRRRFPVSISTIKFWETSGTPSPIACTVLDRLQEDYENDKIRPIRELQSA